MCGGVIWCGGGVTIIFMCCSFRKNDIPITIEILVELGKGFSVILGQKGT